MLAEVEDLMSESIFRTAIGLVVGGLLRALCTFLWLVQEKSSEFFWERVQDGGAGER